MSTSAPSQDMNDEQIQNLFLDAVTKMRVEKAQEALTKGAQEQLLDADDTNCHDKKASDFEYGCDYPTTHPDWPFNQLSLDYATLGCPEIEVIDAAQITPFFFYRNYVAKNRPVIINGLLKNWPAMKLWTDEYLLEKVGESEVTIDFTPDGRADAIINNGNYPVLSRDANARQLEEQKEKDAEKTFNSNNAKSDKQEPQQRNIPPGMYSDLFAVPFSRKMKFKDFLPYISYYPEVVYNHNHRDMEYEYYYSLHQFNLLNMTSSNNTHKSILTQTLPNLDLLKHSHITEIHNGDNNINSLSTLYTTLQSQTTTPLYRLPGIPYCQRQNSSFNDEFAPLHGDIPLEGFDWANECFGDAPQAVNIWVGSSFSHTSLHQDHFENLYSVIQGEKQFILSPPSEVYWLQKAKIPTVQWALIAKEKNENDESGELSTISLQKDANDRFFYIFTHPVEEKEYRFYVVDRTSGDNEEYFDFDQLIQEDDLNKKVKQPKATIQDNLQSSTQSGAHAQEKFINDLTPIDFSCSNHKYLITKNDCYVEDISTKGASPENFSDIEIYPLIMVKKGSYVTIPVFNIPFAFGHNDDDLLAEVSSEFLETAPEKSVKAVTADNTPESTLSQQDQIRERIHKDLQITPWIDVDIEINPLNFTPGSTRTKHQQTNAHIVRYVANLKKGQTLYLPKQWYHSVRQKNKTVSINYWYDMEYDGHYVLHEFIRRVAEQKHKQFQSM